jgi:CheY-like chemotaxis protein
VTPGQYVQLAVTDTGTGMSKETVARAFEPFFTTKADGKGTGLGLSMVYGFVKQSGGHVKIYSEAGHGTTVKIYLPRSKGEEDALEDYADEVTARSGETILVVEDEAEVLTAAVETLGELGYSTLRAGDAASALAVLESGAQVDLLFTDVIMPGPMKAVELARVVADRFPQIPVLFTSGYTENAIIHHGRLDEGVNFLSKPYKKEDLAWKVRAVLSARPKPVVLVVEDDMLVRMSAIDMLSELGFAVEEASNGATALDRLRNGTAVDVLLTDIGLPDIGGKELAGKARALHPGLKVIFATGYHRDAAEPDDETTAFLAKPYEAAQLARALERVTQARPT